MLRCRLSIHMVDDASEQDLLDVVTGLQSAYASRPDLVPFDRFGGAVVEFNTNRDGDQPRRSWRQFGMMIRMILLASALKSARIMRESTGRAIR
jgi:hypothetical protein